MKRVLFRIFLWFSGLILMLLLLIGVFLYRLDINDYRGEIEQSFFESTGLRLELHGQIQLFFKEDLKIELSDVNLYDSLGLVVHVDTIDLNMPLNFPWNKLLVQSAVIHKPLYRYRTKGIVPYNIRKEYVSKASMLGGIWSLESIRIDSITLLNGKFTLEGEGDEVLIDVKGINSANSTFLFDFRTKPLHAFNIESMASYESINAFGFQGHKGSLNFNMEKGLLIFDSKCFNQDLVKFKFGINLNPRNVIFQLVGNFENEDLVEHLARHSGQKQDFFKGDFAGKFNLKFHLTQGQFSLQSLSGDALLTSNNSKLYGISLDKMVKHFKKTQSFSFKDLGSVMLFGAVGIAVSKGTDYAAALKTRESDSTLLEYLHGDFHLDSGLLDFRDVAFRTQRNRLALAGKIDPLNSKYKHFSYALLDEKGCSMIREEFDGPFELAEGDGISNLALLFGPVTNLFKSTSSVIIRNDCKKVYDGSVGPPSKQSNIFKRFLRPKSKDRK
ncbi:MAG: AsmA-like C-terminal region-containing protein [Vicingaceae bacterium]